MQYPITNVLQSVLYSIVLIPICTVHDMWGLGCRHLHLRSTLILRHLLTDEYPHLNAPPLLTTSSPHKYPHLKAPHFFTVILMTILQGLIIGNGGDGQAFPKYRKCLPDALQMAINCSAQANWTNVTIPVCALSPPPHGATHRFGICLLLSVEHWLSLWFYKFNYM